MPTTGKSGQLTTHRLFSDPPLTLSAPHSFTFAPDGASITFLRISPDNRQRMDLWSYNLTSAEQRCLLDARAQSQTLGDVTKLTKAERAERERRREFAFGITQYEWHPSDMSMLVPIDGQAYLVDLALTNPVWRRLTPAGKRQTGFKFSPHGNFVSYVREGDLYYIHAASGMEYRVTHDAAATLTNGLPDFLAAEEMHRFSGHWWAPDESEIAYCKVDESGVNISHRLEIDASGTRTIEQRYPYAGGTNPRVALYCHNVVANQPGSDQANDPLVWSSSTAWPYLARVHFTELGLFIQIQDRLQKRLSLQQWVAGAWESRYEEQSRTWINLSDDFRVVGNLIVFTSEDRGTRRAMTLGDNLRDLDGPTHINKVMHASADVIFVTGWDDSPIENHLYAVRLDGSGFEQLSHQPGWHDVTVDKAGHYYIDRFSSESLPARISLGTLPYGEEGRQGPEQRTEQHAGQKGQQSEQVLFAEELTADHPYAPFAVRHAKPIFGSVQAEDGQEMYYRITPPRVVDGKHPVIVYVYGGPGAQKVRREWGSMLLQLFAEEGFGVLELDNRGSANRGSKFEAPIYRALGHSEVRDQEQALDLLDAHDWADQDRVGVFGHSYGGYMTLMCLCQSDRFRAGVAVAPVCDWRLYDTHYTERYMGLPDIDEKAYDNSNVLSHLSRLQRPLLLMHGMADDNVLFTHSTLLMSELQQLQKPFQLMTYPGAKHSMQERHVSIHRFSTIFEFFRRTLG